MGGVKIEDYKGKTSKDFSLLPDGSFACGDISGFRRPMFKGSDIWDDYFHKTTADYFVIIDDDCEILDKALLKRMLDYMVQHDVDIFSADRTAMQSVYDTYSDADIIAMPRNDTWLCIYDMKQCRCNESFALLDVFVTNDDKRYLWRSSNWTGLWTEYERHFRNKNGTRYVYDDSAYMQSLIKEKTGKPYLCIHDIYDNDCSYIHYAHFSANTQINSNVQMYVYRNLILLGYRSRSKFIRKCVNACKRKLFANADKSRLRDNIISQLD